MADKLKGRRLPDMKANEWPDNIKAGYYWKLIGADGLPVKSSRVENLTGTCWVVVVPMSYGYAVGTLTIHTVREHEDGTISVRPGDGSILITGHRGEQWHGYIFNGVFEKTP